MSEYSRRQFLTSLSLLGVAPAISGTVFAQAESQDDAIGPYPSAWLPAGIRSRFVHDINGLRVHVLDAGYEVSGRGALLLLHGFPELA